jgi:predicted dehydrogenase
VRRALDAGAAVFVEKPLALTAAQADRCAARAAALDRVGMVGHLLRYHPAVVQLVSLTRAGRLGELVSFSSARLSTNGRGGPSALWTLGPHDLSVLVELDPSPLREAWAQLSDDGEHVTLEMRLESGLAARIELCRSSPLKERRMRLVGTSRAAIFDDVRAPDRIVLSGGCGAGGAAGDFLHELTVPWREPLALELDHFLRCVEDGAQPLTPLEDGAAVVHILERAEATLARPASRCARTARTAATG